MHQFPKFIFGIKLYMFRTVPLFIIRSFSLYTQQWYMSANLYDIHHCYVYSEKLLMMDRRTVRNMQNFISFDVLLTAHLSTILAINQLNAQNSSFIISLLYSSTCFEHYVLIIRRSKLYYTASDIITPVGGRPVHRLR